MGGKGSGGRRGGAGRKKKPTHLRGIDGGAGRRGPADPLDGQATTPVADVTLLEPPAGIGASEAETWRAWAPLAHAVGTLTAGSAANFGLLCQAVADRRELRARNGWRGEGGGGEPRPLLVTAAKEELAFLRMDLMLTKTIHAWMKDFMIAPFGKELGPPRDSGAGVVDPIQRFMR